MELFYAQYASLEDAFLRYVRQERKAPLEPWLVVCASSFLAQRLSARLAREQGAVANIYFVTPGTVLHHLDQSAGPALPKFPQNHLRDFLLQEILTEPGLDRYPPSRGFAGALKASLRDLADSLASPDVLEEHLRTTADPAFEQDVSRLAWITRLYRRYLERENNVPGYRSYQAFFERALEQVPTSAYLKKFTHILWYGFYDMSGRQLELVKTIQVHYPVTAFVPYAPLPSFRFAKKFFEANWLGTARAHDVEQTSGSVLAPIEKYLFASAGSAPVRGVKIVSAAQPSGEVFFAAKEILNLVEKQGFHFDEIAVLARNAAPYQDELRRVFTQNYIPLQADFCYRLDHFPLGVFCLNLFSLAVNGFDRETVLAVLSSPYFKAVKKQAWRTLAFHSLASRDLNQWKDLLPVTEYFDPDFLHWLETCHDVLSGIDLPQAWGKSVQAALQFLQDNTDETVLHGKENEIFNAVCECINSLGEYAVIRPFSKPGEFTRELLNALNTLDFHETEAVREGVTFTDVQRARGLSFKVVFLLGMTEKSFPLLQPEDPILRDRYRYILRDMLGFWINQQGERAEEERLLFFVAASSAIKRLYVSYARMDEGGKETVPSVYLAELARACELNQNSQQFEAVSGRLSERIGAIPAYFLTAKEISYSLILNPAAAGQGYQDAGLWTPEKERALAAAGTLRSLGALTAQDGLVSSGGEIFERINQGAGFSPSALEELAACPLKFFFRKGLHLNDTDEPASRQDLAPNKRGTVYHEVLQEFYQNLRQRGLTHQLFDDGIAAYVEQAFDRHYTLQSGRAFGIYPLLWDLMMTELKRQLVAFAQEDIKNLKEYTPTFFEKEFSRVQTQPLPFRLRGKIDRIDINEQTKTFEIADYKSSKKGGKDLVQAFFTYRIFQPFLYMLAAQTLPELNGYTPAGACLLAIQKSYNRRDLTTQQFAELCPSAEQFFAQLVEFVKQGQFFLHPCDLCAYCPFAPICRKDHFASFMRARKSVPGGKLEEMYHGPC